jgi:hypothetical protein
MEGAETSCSGHGLPADIGLRAAVNQARDLDPRYAPILTVVEGFVVISPQTTDTICASNAETMKWDNKC